MAFPFVKWALPWFAENFRLFDPFPQTLPHGGYAQAVALFVPESASLSPISNSALWPKTQIASYGEVPSNAHAKGHATFAPKVTLPLPKGHATFVERSRYLCRKVWWLSPNNPPENGVFVPQTAFGRKQF